MQDQLTRASDREVEIVSPDYQPSAEESEENVGADATFNEAVDALTRPVSIRYVDRPEPAPIERVSALFYLVPCIG